MVEGFRVQHPGFWGLGLRVLDLAYKPNEAGRKSIRAESGVQLPPYAPAARAGHSTDAACWSTPGEGFGSIAFRASGLGFRGSGLRVYGLGLGSRVQG